MRFAVWGLAFKAGTDDMRDAPSIVVVNRLLELGANIQASDPIASETAREHFRDRITYTDMYGALNECDALIILTEWPAYLEPDFALIKERLKEPVVFDGRNIYRRHVIERQGFTYYGIGTNAVGGDEL